MCDPYLDHQRKELKESEAMKESNVINPDNSKVKGVNYVNKIAAIIYY